MSTIEEKNAARRDAFIRHEANKLVSIKEAEAIAAIVKPDFEAKIRVWIKEEVARSSNAALLNLRMELLKSVKAEVQKEVSAYCKSIFDSNAHEDYIHMRADEPDDGVVVCSPPSLIRSDQ